MQQCNTMLPTYLKFCIIPSELCPGGLKITQNNPLVSDLTSYLCQIIVRPHYVMSCQNYEQSGQKMDKFFENKVPRIMYIFEKS